VLRHYSFVDRPFVVNCSLDLKGRFVTEPGPVDWCFNCDICTPPFVADGDVYSVDLFVDVLVAPDGRRCFVGDEDEFTEAVECGWVTAGERVLARRGLAELLWIIESVGLVEFLEEILAFDDVRADAWQASFTRRSVAEIPLLKSEARERRFGVT
jgi:hypothetical protein